jgi:hypothetical protein
MDFLPIDSTLLKLFVVFTCFFYWIRIFARRAIRGQQPHFYRDRGR